MAKIERKTQQIFASQSGADEKAVFGTMKTGNPVYSNDVETLQNNPAFLQGWQEATIEGKNPFLEEFNGINYANTSQLAYLFQQGMPEWDSQTVYYINSYCQMDGRFYKSLTDDNVGNNPTSDTTNWQYQDSANADLSNLSATGEKHFLNKSQITNCVIEAPHVINLALSNGIITLKAGSEVVVPYGTTAPTLAIGDNLTSNLKITDISWANNLLFYICQLQADKSWTYTGVNFADVPLTYDLRDVVTGQAGSTFSGTTPPSSTNYFYDTVQNRCYRGTQPTYLHSLPFADVALTSGTGVTAINEIFQITGEIGSVQWCNKGVKGLAPNYKNSDGTYNSTIVEAKSVLIQDIDSALANRYNQPLYLSIGQSIGIISNSYFDSNSGVIRSSNGNDVVGRVEIARVTTNTTQGSAVQEFKPSNTFLAVDYNDVPRLAFDSMLPDYSAGVVLNSYLISGATGFTCPADGFISLQMYVGTNACNIYLNGVQICQKNAGSGTYYSHWSGYVQKYNIITGDLPSNIANGDGVRAFYPLKGVK